MKSELQKKQTPPSRPDPGLGGVVSMLLAWVMDRMVVDVIMGYRHFQKSMIE